ncbi:MAG TPA: hypothetical protein VFE05_17060 [Longimicrobiaceae bacterium]|jgi:hypothetical protein|nr:hypothetical protein [Longimicrobiaceae bacterium]
MPPITVNVDFVGLCLFVSDPATPKMDVLLLAPDLDPDAIPSGPGGLPCGCAKERHHPRIFYNSAYDVEGAPLLKGSFSSIALEDKVLDFTGFGGDLSHAIPAVPNLSQAVDRTVPKFRVSDAPLDLVTSRVSFASGTGAGVVAEHPWELGALGSDVAIAHKVRWTFTVPGPRLDWSLGGLNGRGGQPLTPLFPLNNTIDLRVVNVLREELFATDPTQQPPPPPDTVMAHFLILYAALADPPAALPLPKWKGQAGNGGAIGASYKCGTGFAVLQTP